MFRVVGFIAAVVIIMAHLPASSRKMSNWTDEDHKECLRLMHKAHGCGVLKALCELVEQETDWSVVSGRNLEGNMSDAAKRQRSDDEANGVLISSPTKPMPSPSQLSYAPLPTAATSGPMLFAGNDPAPVVQLPTGVASLEVWGRTKVSFGKFMNKRTYMSLHLSTDPEDRRYKSWLSSRISNGSPQLQDLVKYLQAMGDVSVTGNMEDKQLVMIPGTDIPRRLG